MGGYLHNCTSTMKMEKRRKQKDFVAKKEKIFCCMVCFIIFEQKIPQNSSFRHHPTRDQLINHL